MIQAIIRILILIILLSPLPIGTYYFMSKFNQIENTLTQLKGHAYFTSKRLRALETRRR